MDDRLGQLLTFLDADDSETIGTSIRLPTNLRSAASLAAEMGLAESTTELTIAGLRDALEAFAQRAVLDAHYAAHPGARPDLADIALAAAEIDGNPLAARPELLRRAAVDVAQLRGDPTPDDVLLYAAGLAASAA
jgi:hypothetical protein